MCRNQLLQLGGTIMQYIPKGVCSKQIDFEIIDNKVRNVVFTRGCSGNTQGVAALIEGMDVNDAIRRLEVSNADHVQHLAQTNQHKL